ncbi:phosphotransferase [Mesorhizobium sp. L-8-3]|uniref:phosphotransferase n=1 Tax=Mesorhizobium sp. L-8-3 TaxID=2744522 RepID=UPI001935DF68|nr:phosphotransferase [Mesorhizobium sp. L-8-3]BCH21216.1 homoserine kinase [Mesorhizobium sp. L-8-3]
MSAADDLPAGLASALDARVRDALIHWTASDPRPRLLKYRENAVFRVELDGKPAALRLHRPGYHDETALRSELAWLAELRAGGMNVPSPLATADGNLHVELPACAELGRQHADVMSWVDGEPLGETGLPLAHPPERLAAIFAAVGAGMADLHSLSDRWTLPAGFRRHAWNLDGLLGDAPLWGRFWDCEGLSTAQSQALSALRHTLRPHLRRLAENGLDYGLIHADLVRENIFVRGDEVAFIDFDDAGFGWRMFDIATALSKNLNEPAWDVIRASLVAGYRSRRALSDDDLATLPLFLVLRSLTYIGWIAQRPEVPHAERRMRRFAEEALDLAAVHALA